MKPAREPASSRPKPCASLKKPHASCPFAALHVALVGRKVTVVRDPLFPQKPPGSRFRFSRTGVQPSPDSSTIELPSAFPESGIIIHINSSFEYKISHQDFNTRPLKPMCCVSYSGLFWTSGLLDVPALIGSHRRKVTQDFSSTFLLLALIFLARRIQF